MCKYRYFRIVRRDTITRINPDVAQNIIDAIINLPTTVFQNMYMHFELLLTDVDDNKFVDCAIAANAEFIVTNDKHFNPLKTIPWPKVEIINLIDFVKQI